MSKKTKILISLFFFCALFCTAAVFAQQGVTPTEAIEELKGETAPPPLVTELAVLVGLAFVPFVVMLMTSFLKIVVVLSLLRNALGVQQSPPNQAINGIALLMTVYVMFPTGAAMYSEAKQYIQEEAPSELFSKATPEFIVNVIDRSKEPFRKFLLKNTSAKHEQYFYQLAYRNFPAEYRQDLTRSDFLVLIPAYITTQIKGAFEIGVLVYLPFFVIDLVTSNILLAMGMMMLSPLTIALPLKLLLVVMVDGWTLVIQGLVLTYR